MRRLLGVLLVLAPLATFAASPEAYDISPVKARLKVFTDGKGHFLVTIPFGAFGDQKWTFFGDGKTFWRQHIGANNSATATSFELHIWDPRLSEQNPWAKFKVGDGQAILHCDDRATAFSPVAEGDGRGLIEQGDFRDYRFQWEPSALARDDDGVYYYVDRPVRREDRSFRLFVGKKNNLKLQKLVDVISDEGGDLFFTKKGKLMVKHFEDSAVWVDARSKKATKLVYLSVARGHHSATVYVDLGVYAGEPFGGACDDL